MKTCLLEAPQGSSSIYYQKEKVNIQSLSEAVSAEEGLPLYLPVAFEIPASSQKVVTTHLLFDLLPKTFLELYSPPEKARSEPFLCPGIVDSLIDLPLLLLLVKPN